MVGMNTYNSLLKKFMQLVGRQLRIIRSATNGNVGGCFKYVSLSSFGKSS